MSIQKEAETHQEESKTAKARGSKQEAKPTQGAAAEESKSEEIHELKNKVETLNAKMDEITRLMQELVLQKKKES